MIPGSNILQQAQALIQPTQVQLHRVTGRTTDARGIDVTTYAAPETILANVQAVRRSQYQRMGLDYNKRYIAIWSSVDLRDLTRDSSGDQITWQGRRHELINEEDWTDIDQWNSVLAIEVAAP